MAAHVASSFGPEIQLREIRDPDTGHFARRGRFGDRRVRPTVSREVRRRASTAPPVQLQRFYVDRPFHGRGVAQSLMRAVDDAGRELGGRTLWLGVWERNPRAIAFYTKCGFVDVGRTSALSGATSRPIGSWRTRYEDDAGQSRRGLASPARVPGSRDSVPPPGLYLLAVGMTITALLMDGLDGWVARRYGEVSRIGAVIDILTDRIVELTYWIAFAALGWIPAWIPIVVAVRGLLVDGARALAFERGLTAFGPTT